MTQFLVAVRLRSQWPMSGSNVRFKGKYEMVARDLEYRHVEQSKLQGRPLKGRTAIVTGAAFNP
jgi:hypothetical protein